MALPNDTMSDERNEQKGRVLLFFSHSRSSHTNSGDIFRTVFTCYVIFSLVQFIRTIEIHNHSQIFFNFFSFCCFSLCLDCPETGWLSSLDKVILCKFTIYSWKFCSFFIHCLTSFVKYSKSPAIFSYTLDESVVPFFHPFCKSTQKNANDKLQTNEVNVSTQPQYTNTCLSWVAVSLRCSHSSVVFTVQMHNIICNATESSFTAKG